MDAQALNCPMCGASISSDAPQCRFCEAQLATVACASCFGMMFLGSKHCPQCGAGATQRLEVTGVGKKCPRCKNHELVAKTLGETKISECEKCMGIWLDVSTFERICAEREQQSAVLGSATLSTADRKITESKVRYIPCPQCSVLMNRANFARCSGVIIDICKRHGLWFDRDELSRIVEFIRDGGLDLARAREKMHLAEERRRVEQLKEVTRTENLYDAEGNITGIVSTRDLLKFLIG